jgi:hypothetical protein
MEKATIPSVKSVVPQAVLNPAFQAALDTSLDYEPLLHHPALEDVLDADPLEAGEELDEEFAALAREVEATGIAAAPSASATAHAVVEDTHATASKISPFALLVGPAPVLAAARHLESLALSRRSVFLFGRKGPADASRPDAEQDEDLDLEEDENRQDPAADGLVRH